MISSCSIVIPVYRSAGTLTMLIERLNKIIPNLFNHYEVILVNDGSPDQSWQVIQSLAINFPYVRGIDLMRNYGQHNAILCGIMEAKYETIITMDDDLQNPPEEIPKLVIELDKGFDLVYGTPAQEKHGIFRDLASVLTKKTLSSLMGINYAPQTGSFRIFRTDLRKVFEQFQGPFINIDVLLSWGTTNISAVKINHLSRPFGKSGYNMRKLVRHAMNLITGFSTLPLQIASILGFIFSILGIIIILYLLIRYFTHGIVVQGFTFLASIIAIFAGVQLFSLGIIGEYLARMYFVLMSKPQFAIRRTTDRKSG